MRFFDCAGEAIHSGDTFTAPLGSSVTVTGTVTERDRIPDVGTGSVRLPLTGEVRSTYIYVRENRGQYAGNLAVWEPACSAELIAGREGA